jgi:peroxiredoxin
LWCDDALQELKPLAQWYAEQQQDSSDVLVIGVHSAGRRASEVQKVIKEHGVEYPVLIDSRSDRSPSLGQLSNKFGVHCVPTTCVIDADGKIAAYGELKEMLAKAGESVAKQRENDKDQPMENE